MQRGPCYFRLALPFLILLFSSASRFFSSCYFPSSQLIRISIRSPGKSLSFLRQKKTLRIRRGDALDSRCPGRQPICLPGFSRQSGCLVLLDGKNCRNRSSPLEAAPQILPFPHALLPYPDDRIGRDVFHKSHIIPAIPS